MQNLPINNILSLDTLVDYHQTGMASKVIYENDHTMVTIFAFTKGYNIPERSTLLVAVIYILEGTAELTIGGKKKSITTGEMVIMPTNEPHAVFAKESFKMLSIRTMP